MRRAPSPRVETAARLPLAIVSGLLLLVFPFVAPWLPRPPFWWALLGALVVNLALLGTCCDSLSPLCTARPRVLLLLAVVGLGAGAAFTALGWVGPADGGKLVLAAAIGYWLAAQIGDLRLVLLVAAVSAAVDLFSVFRGPTKAILEQAPRAVDYLTVAFAWPGYHPTEMVTALGISDVIFFCLYLGVARRFGLRPLATALALCAAIVATVAIGVRWGALPVLPMLALAFVAANVDVLLRRD